MTALRPGASPPPVRIPTRWLLGIVRLYLNHVHFA
jgi:hypothetical protein